MATAAITIKGSATLGRRVCEGVLQQFAMSSLHASDRAGTVQETVEPKQGAASPSAAFCDAVHAETCIWHPVPHVDPVQVLSTNQSSDALMDQRLEVAAMLRTRRAADTCRFEQHKWTFLEGRVEQFGANELDLLLLVLSPRSERSATPPSTLSPSSLPPPQAIESEIL
jgi:hypothetical protein